MLILKIIAIWTVISIPVSLFLGKFLSNIGDGES